MSVIPLVMVLVILASGVVFASRSAMPGDALYGAKRAVEDLRFTLTIDSQARQALSNEFEQERIREINTLLRDGKSADVEFKGFIEVIGTDSWIVAGIPMQLDPETKIDGEPRVGYRALVKGKAADGRLTTREVIVKGNGLTLPEILPTRPKIDPRKLADPLATESPTNTPQPSPTPSETPSPTITQTPTPSPELSPMLSISPTPDHDGDDGGEDDGVGDDGSEDDGVEDDGVEDDGSEDDGVENDSVEDDGVEDDGVEDDGVEDDGVEDDDDDSGSDGSGG